VTILCQLLGKLGKAPAAATFTFVALAVVSHVLASTALAAELNDAEQLFFTGEYANCAEMAAAEIDTGQWDANWHRLKALAELEQGQYQKAERTVEEGIDSYPYNLQLRLLASAVYRQNGKAAEADAALAAIEQFVGRAPRRYSGREERIALGRFLLERGADPRQVLELVYDPLRKESPDFAEVYFATAELALDKYDHALAAEILNAAPKSSESDPRHYSLLARAYASDEPVHAEAALSAALALNPHHTDSLLLRVDNLIDREEYGEAEKTLDTIFEVNLHHPIAWAYKAVLAHLTNNAQAEEQARSQALAIWTTNPQVDHVIGRKLSEKYRFAEGAACQRRALALDRDFRPAKLQLSQDLLRLGEEEEGWRLADEVAKQDAYDVVAFNLVTLEKELAKYRTVESDGLIVRMEATEAALYGDRVLELLRRARATLCKKYDVELNPPIVIEIFPQQKDFAVRTFGLPGADGFLGVCFGRVITANSPASQGERPANWEAVLWHEFCHVVTLHKTRNKMPRWLSEGISVYEEKQANATWGQSMTPEYREIILSGKMAPVSKLSAAFLAPPTPMHLQFAYYQSSLVVEFLIERYGAEKLQTILSDLGDGLEINEALLRHTAPLGQLDMDFVAFARARAEALAPGADWEEPDLPADADAATIGAWVSSHPKNVPSLQTWAQQLLRERKFTEAAAASEQLRSLFSDNSGAAEAYRLLAAAHRGASAAEDERKALQELAARDPDATDAYLRLMELAAEEEDWDEVATNARRMLAVNPLVPAPHRYLAQAAEKLGKRSEAIAAYRAMLQFDTTDAAETHFRLATLLREDGEQKLAKRHVLSALEEAPRFLAAHQLLLELIEGVRTPSETQTATEAISQ
jgi:tetratricopeptide (TPR) repeat protein